MFKHIVVPLDGSKLAEAVLPVVAYLAQRLGASVTLLHVIERNPPQEVHGERHLTDEQEAYRYLKEVTQRTFPPGMAVDQHVHTTEVSDVPRSIVDHAGELQTDLIALCTHGRSGPREWLFGPIAQQVVALGTTPVLLVHPGEDQSEASFNCQNLLVPLDGNPEHEEGLQVAAGLARACTASLHLVMVVHTVRTLPGEQAATATLLPGATSAMLEISEQSATHYLENLEHSLENRGIKVTSQVERGDPAKKIVQAAEQSNSDLIILSTHGKTHMDAFWSGSLTPKIAGRSHIPLILVPVGDEVDSK